MRDEKVETIIRQLTENKTRDDHPAFLLIGGGMQTGQGSFLAQLVESGVIDRSRTVVITPSAFLSMPGFEPVKDVQHPEKLPHLLPAYQEIVRETVRTAARHGYSVALVDHAEDPDFIQSLHDICKAAGHRTLLAGMFSRVESYFNYANCTEEFFDRKADHDRGFRFLRDFARNFDRYLETFDQTSLFETHFSRGEKEGLPHIAIRKVADFEFSRFHGVESFIYDRTAITRFYDNAHLDASAPTPAGASARLAARLDFCALPCAAEVPDLLRDQGSISGRFAAASSSRDLSAGVLKQFRKIMVPPVPLTR